MQDITYQFFCATIFFVNFYLFIVSKRSSDYIPSLMYGYFILLGSAFLSIKTVPFSIGYERYIFIIFFYIGLFTIDYILVNYRNKYLKNEFKYSISNYVFSGLTLFLFLVPLIHILIAGYIPLFDYITGNSDYNKNRELFSKLLDINFLVKYIPNYIFSIISPLLVYHYYKINKKKISFTIFLYSIFYAILSAAVLPVVIFTIITFTIIFNKKFKTFKIFFSFLLVIGFTLAYYEANNLHKWINSQKLSTGIYSEYTYVKENFKGHPILISDINRMSCSIPYEFSEGVPQLSMTIDRAKLIFNRFCNGSELVKHDSDVCTVDADCPSKKCRMDLSGNLLCIPKNADCAIDSKRVLNVGDHFIDSDGAHTCEASKSYLERPTLFFNKLSNILYRLYLVPPDVGFSWFFYKAANKINFDAVNILDEFKLRSNIVGVWAYADRFPTRYLKSVSAYGSFDLDGYFLFGVKSILASLMIYFLIRFFALFTNSVFYLMVNVLLSIFIWQAGPYSIVISHGVWILLLIGVIGFVNYTFFKKKNSEII